MKLIYQLIAHISSLNCNSKEFIAFKKREVHLAKQSHRYQETLKN
jgi:hypothetical protein